MRGLRNPGQVKVRESISPGMKHSTLLVRHIGCGLQSTHHRKAGTLWKNSEGLESSAGIGEWECRSNA